MCCCVIDLYFLLKETARPPSRRRRAPRLSRVSRSLVHVFRRHTACPPVSCLVFSKVLKVRIRDLHHFLARDAVGHAVCAWACRLGPAPDPKKIATDWDHMVAMLGPCTAQGPCTPFRRIQVISMADMASAASELRSDDESLLLSPSLASAGDRWS